MDRPTTRMDADARTPRTDLADPDSYVAPSRQALLDLARAALDLGPILITGDVGIGKTWTVARLTSAVPGCRWVGVDLTPADGPADLYRHLARGLGMAAGPGVAPTRLDVAEALAERLADDEAHGLVIDEAQNLASAVWEEVRVLANRLGRPDGFAHLILVGQTALVRRFATRTLAAIEARLAGHLHLRPLDLVEAGVWLGRRHPGREFSTDEIEAIHRDSGGNPSRLLRRSAALAARPAATVTSGPPQLPAVANLAAETPPDDPAPAAMTAPRAPESAPNHRPPLHVEENAIEVGWSTDEAVPTSDDLDDGEPLGVSIAPRAEPSDQAVHDHYAALQAWREWASNQEIRHRTDRDLADAIDEAAAAEAADHAVPIATDRGQVRAEGQQSFAPFGQLFPRLNAAREANLPRT